MSLWFLLHCSFINATVSRTDENGGESGWSLSRSFSSSLNLGEPMIQLALEGEPIPEASLTVLCLVWSLLNGLLIGQSDG